MRYLNIIIVFFMTSVLCPTLINLANGQEVTRTVVYQKKSNKRAKTKQRKIANKRVVKVAHHGYRTLPVWRATVAIRPANAVMLRKNGLVFHYRDGIFYRSLGSKYVVTRPTIGIRISVLPVGTRMVALANSSYYYYYGTFYAPIQGGRAFEVIRAPSGAVVNALPEGYAINKVNGTKYYVLDHVHYQEVETSEVPGGIGYRVVKV